MQKEFHLEISVPLLIRLLEWAREECKSDEQIHTIVDNLISKQSEKYLLDMNDYKSALNEFQIADIDLLVPPKDINSHLESANMALEKNSDILYHAHMFQAHRLEGKISAAEGHLERMKELLLSRTSLNEYNIHSITNQRDILSDYVPYQSPQEHFNLANTALENGDKVMWAAHMAQANRYDKDEFKRYYRLLPASMRVSKELYAKLDSIAPLLSSPKQHFHAAEIARKNRDKQGWVAHIAQAHRLGGNHSYTHHWSDRLDESLIRSSPALAKSKTLINTAKNTNDPDLKKALLRNGLISLSRHYGMETEEGKQYLILASDITDDEKARKVLDSMTVSRINEFSTNEEWPYDTKPHMNDTNYNQEEWPYDTKPHMNDTNYNQEEWPYDTLPPKQEEPKEEPKPKYIDYDSMWSRPIIKSPVPVVKKNQILQHLGLQEQNCWSGYKKVGTKEGTGKNRGERVNDCKKI